MFNREELIVLRNKAYEASETPHLTRGWRRAYLSLADAANHLDAIIARTEVFETDADS